MAYTINLYQVTEDSKTYPKTVTTPISTHSFLLKDGCSIDKPVVSFSGGGAVMSTINYAQIPEFQGRYYNIADRKMTVSGVCELTLESDPLQTFWTQVVALDMTIKRQENARQGYLNDDGYNALAYEKVQTKEFPNALDDMSYILMTVG